MSNDTIKYLDLAPGIKITSRPRSWREPWRSRTAKTRIFLNIEGESILENFVNRTSRPAREWGKIIRNEVLPALGMEGVKARWSQKAGCSMCPCSPGWILDGRIIAKDHTKADDTDAELIINLTGEPYVCARDVWVTVNLDLLGIPAYVSTGETAIERASREAQLLAQIS